MFSWFKNKSEAKESRSLIGDLDALTRKTFYVKYQGTEWKMPELTAGEYAHLCYLLEDLEKLSANKEQPGRVDEIYNKILSLCIPTLPNRIKKKMPLVDAHAMFLTVLKRYGMDVEKKKTAQKKSVSQ
jgi:hypothetical protein